MVIVGPSVVTGGCDVVMLMAGVCSLLIAESVDGSECGGPVGRVDAEEQPDEERYTEGQGHGVGLDDRRDPDDLEMAAYDPGGHARETADERQQDRLDQELAENVELAGADRLADPDLTSAFGDGDEHDVHHADSAHEQADGRHRAEEHGEGLGGG